MVMLSTSPLLVLFSILIGYSDSALWFPLIMIIIVLVIFCVWIGVGIWVYKDAKKRNENALLWFLIVFFAGWLGLLLWFVFRSQGGRKTAPRRICPNCGREIPFDANLCSYCGKKFESPL